MSTVLINTSGIFIPETAVFGESAGQNDSQV